MKGLTHLGEVGPSSQPLGFEGCPTLCSAISSMWPFLSVCLQSTKMVGAGPYTTLSLTTIQGERDSPQLFSSCQEREPSPKPSHVLPARIGLFLCPSVRETGKKVQQVFDGRRFVHHFIIMLLRRCRNVAPARIKQPVVKLAFSYASSFSAIPRTYPQHSVRTYCTWHFQPLQNSSIVVISCVKTRKALLLQR